MNEIRFLIFSFIFKLTEIRIVSRIKMFTIGKQRLLIYQGLERQNFNFYLEQVFKLFCEISSL